MKIQDSAFYGITFFILGVGAFSFLSCLKITVVAILASAVILFWNFIFNKDPKKFKFYKWIGFLFLFVIIGASYSSFYKSYQQKQIKIIFNQKHKFFAVVDDSTIKEKTQNVTVNLIGSERGLTLERGKVSATLRNIYPQYKYGDLIEFEGIIKPADESGYNLRNNIQGKISFPTNKFISENNGNKLQQFLYSIKNKIIDIFQQTLPNEQAAFLSGITLGERAQFSSEFKNQMSKSGTTHVVALSGQNITILVNAILLTLGTILSRRKTFIFTIITIILFVLMTGAEASVIRAAIMGSLVLIAQRSQRIYSVRNAIVFAALGMVLVNPYVINFDIGFQLSFLALMGILYLQPIINKYLNKNNKKGLLDWRENMVATISAQAAVVPILISQFNNFSITSISANVLILGVIPLTMGIGFFIGIIGLFIFPLAQILAWGANILLSYELSIIKFFGTHYIGIESTIPIFWVIIYYLIIGGIIFYYQKKERNKKLKEIDLFLNSHCHSRAGD